MSGSRAGAKKKKARVRRPKGRVAESPPTLAPPRPVRPVREVGAAEFKNKCLELLDGVREGRFEVLVTKHGKPTARVVAPEQPPASLWGSMRGTIHWDNDEDLIAPELDIWKDYL